jgi:phosphatidylglycerol---prolipoprotein diacylglyceryl transferase
VQLAQTAINSAAIGLAVLVSRATSKRIGLSVPQWLALVAGALAGGALAAAVPQLLGFADGRDLVFGALGGYAGIEVARRASSLRAPVADFAVVPVALGLALGRLGCFVAGCCAGTPASVSWAHDFGDGVPRHPTQLYEVAFHLVAAIVFGQLGRRRRMEGLRAWLYVLAYLAFRFASEFVRPGGSSSPSPSTSGRARSSRSSSSSFT